MLTTEQQYQIQALKLKLADFILKKRELLELELDLNQHIRDIEDQIKTIKNESGWPNANVV